MNRNGQTELVWSDEFDFPADTPPDWQWWTHETGGGGWSNGELQHYTAELANAAHDGAGNLVIRAQRHADRITSARLVTKGKFEFRYGRIESRVFLPAGRGLWAAVWTLGADIDRNPWPGCGEIDVMEWVGADPDRVFGTLHCPAHSGRDGISGGYRASEVLAGGYHVYAAEWSADRVTWSMDGQAYFQASRHALGRSWVFDRPFFVLINLAVGGWLGGDIGRETRFPAEMKIDYIRVYRL